MHEYNFNSYNNMKSCKQELHFPINELFEIELE